MQMKFRRLLHSRDTDACGGKRERKFKAPENPRERKDASFASNVANSCCLHHYIYAREIRLRRQSFPRSSHVAHYTFADNGSNYVRYMFVDSRHRAFGFAIANRRSRRWLTLPKSSPKSHRPAILKSRYPHSRCEHAIVATIGICLKCRNERQRN